MNQPPRQPRRFFLAALLPGILVAATGVGAGDLLTASLAGSRLGLTVLWACVAGAVLKWFLNEGIARWQMATRTTLLEGWVEHLGRWVQWVFLIYLLIWSFATGGALISACGLAGTGILPLGDPATSKIIWGVVHSLLGLILVRIGGYALFSRLMAACIAVMFITVIATAIFIRPDAAEVAAGLTSFSIPRGPGNEDALPLVLGLLGGVGGTVTLLSYGYWIREAGREGHAGIRACRIDLAVGYTMTALFGIAMVIIGSRIRIEKGGMWAVELADQLGAALGPIGRWAFLLGFWGAVFSSLLGVWQSVPYIFADFLLLRRKLSPEDRARVDLDATPAYRNYLFALAIVPMPLLFRDVKQVQIVYAMLGALFMPLLALTLLILNNRASLVGSRFRNGIVVNVALVVTLSFFAYQGGLKVYSLLV